MNKQSPEYLNDLRHSTAHLLAAAVMELWPDTKRTIGPSIENGFYFDFEFSKPISESDFPAIEAKMKEIAKSWKGFERSELSPEEARKEYPDNQYKHELIDEFSGEGQTLTFYKSGEYWDLCRGGHVQHPNSELKHFKLLKIAGAYWRGNEKNPMLTRIYGTAFATKDELEAHLLQLEEAKKRDHRKLGKELELFFIDDMVGKGLVMWLPKGTILRDQVEKLAKEKEAAAGYLRVATPHIAKEELFLTSGHLPYYKDSMYPPMVMDDGTYYLKAMNCPHHHRIFQFRPRSYKELPLRLAEYGTCYRNELSGTLAGLLRVRGMTMNDAHMYCTKEQIKDEFTGVLKLTMEYFEIFGLKDYWFRLSKWDPKHTEKYIDEPENWKFSESVLREVLEKLGVKFVEVDDEAAFYGPKVDVQFKSVIGREETMSTIQLDFAAKKRFGLHYTDEKGKENGDVFVIHRAPLSVHERFMAFLIEHFAGAFPLWLSPVQAVVIPISQDQAAYAAKVVATLQADGIRAENWDEAESMQNKIRKAEGEKIPYMLVVGKREEEGEQVSVRARGNKNRGVWTVGEFTKELMKKIDTRSREV
ncbi:MAG: threonine--tRNA ligase [Candidatus Woesebacteria bacterium]